MKLHLLLLLPLLLSLFPLSCGSAESVVAIKTDKNAAETKAYWEKEYKKIHICEKTTDSDAKCPSIYRPVCATMKNGETKTFANSCTACVFNHAVSWKYKKCPSK